MNPLNNKLNLRNNLDGLISAVRLLITKLSWSLRVHSEIVIISITTNFSPESTTRSAAALNVLFLVTRSVFPSWVGNHCLSRQCHYVVHYVDPMWPGLFLYKASFTTDSVTNELAHDVVQIIVLHPTPFPPPSLPHHPTHPPVHTTWLTSNSRSSLHIGNQGYQRGHRGVTTDILPGGWSTKRTPFHNTCISQFVRQSLPTLWPYKAFIQTE